MASVDISADLFDSLTLEDIEAIEDLTGVDIDDLFGEAGVQVRKSKILRAFAFVLLRRTDPTITVESTAKLTLKALQELIASAEVAPAGPPVAAG